MREICFTEEQIKRILKDILVDAKNIPNYTEEQWDALCEEIPMTQEIFEECLDACCRIGNIDEFFNLLDRFPNETKVFNNKIDKEIEKSKNNIYRN